jgi:hypothetical protein
MEILPTSPYGSQPGGEIPLRDRVHNNLLSMQHTHAELQISLAAQDTASHIEGLLQQLQPPIQDLVQISLKHPPMLSQNEMDVINSIRTQFQTMQTDPKSITPSDLAALQGNSSTLDQMFAAEAAGIPEPNVAALKAQNHLSALSDTLHLHLKTHAVNSSEAEALVNSMQDPVAELNQLSKTGVLTPAQSDVVADLTTAFTTTIHVPGMATPQAIAQFTAYTEHLNQLLLS